MSKLNALISPLAIAPMIDWTYSHFRVLLRMIAPQALLYTEMQTVGALKNKPELNLFYTPMEDPLALQMGGANEIELADCARLAQDLGYAEINLNLGCPSDRVQAGRFGACLMAEPKLVTACIRRLKATVSIPVTAKTRIGIDNLDSYAFFSDFAHHLIEAGCDKLIVHARKAWLSGLSPKQNRSIPPLHYDFAYRLKAELPEIPIVLNGNIQSIEDIIKHSPWVDGVMLGRLACSNPYALALIHKHIFPQQRVKSRIEIIDAYFAYLRIEFARGQNLSHLLKPILNLAHGLAGAKEWKTYLLQAQQSKNLDPLKNARAVVEKW